MDLHLKSNILKSANHSHYVRYQYYWNVNTLFYSNFLLSQRESFVSVTFFDPEISMIFHISELLKSKYAFPRKCTCMSVYGGCVGLNDKDALGRIDRVMFISSGGRKKELFRKSVEKRAISNEHWKRSYLASLFFSQNLSWQYCSIEKNMHV